MNLGGCTTQGPREANEDSFFVLDFSDVHSISGGIVAFALVSDGMGGYLGGDVASGITVGCAKTYLEQLLSMAREHQLELDPNAALAEIARNAHESILGEAHRRGNASMGATFVGAFVGLTHAWIGHIGDSRAYLLRDGKALQLTQDHSHVGRLLSQGVITEKEAQNHPDRNRIERALGFSDATPEFTEVDLQPGDGLLLCTDGVYTVLDSGVLADCVRRANGADDAAHRVVKKALSRDTDDNATCVVVVDAPAEAGATLRFSQAVAEDGTIVSEPVATPAWPTQESTPIPAHSGRAATVVPLLLGAALCATLVGFFLKTGRSIEGGAPNTPAEQGEASTSSEGADKANTEEVQESADATDAAATSTEQQAPASEEGFATYAVSDADLATLKYVDAAGVAQDFSYAPLEASGAPAFNVGAELQAKTEENAYGRTTYQYRQLSDTYLTQLMDDVALAREGTTVFASELSHMTDPDQYAAFVQVLAGLDQETLKVQVAHLLVVSTALEQDVPATGEQVSEPSEAPATEAPTTESQDASSPDEGTEDYGGRPSAGALEGGARMPGDEG